MREQAGQPRKPGRLDARLKQMADRAWERERAARRERNLDRARTALGDRFLGRSDALVMLVARARLEGHAARLRDEQRVAMVDAFGFVPEELR